MNLEFHPAVQRDVNEILAFYQKEASGALADRFFAAMQSRLAEIAAEPSDFPIGLRTRGGSALSSRAFLMSSSFG